LLFCAASAINPAPFTAVAPRLVLVSGDRGLSASVAARAEPRLPGCRRVMLADYDAPAWADTVSDRTETIVEALRNLAGDATAAALPPGAGVHAGITYQIHGSGPALVLFPLFLEPSQWDAAIPILARHFTVIVLGGRHVGGVAILEGRAGSPSYTGMVHNLLDVIEPANGETIREVGCGSGALVRRMARRFEGNPFTAADVNPFLLREASALAQQDGLDKRITFREGNAERLPFADGSFDHAYTVTVLEECNADMGLRELWRVVKPGGRVGVIVRGIDMTQSWHVHLPEAIRSKIETPPQSVAAGGVADHSLYRRMGAAGFVSLTCFPTLACFDQRDEDFLRYREEAALSRLDAEETEVWHEASRKARAAGVLFVSNPFHRVVGRKPATD
jgi:ubiquinone/menaquinone biosynthesis C-methylase UbiE